MTWSDLNQKPTKRTAISKRFLSLPGLHSKISFGIPVGDIAEYTALKRVFGDHLKESPLSATKSSTGHLLGGAGAIEAVFTVLALHHRTAPPTLNLDNPDPAIDLDVVVAPRTLGENVLAISNSFGFGGHNAVIAFRSYNQ
jgi:3-oxoacyl-[acyl-carrier-protein] synthase II